MEFLNKLANVVVTNPLIKDFEILDIVTQAGPWVIHNAVKRSTKERVSVFVLSKKMFDKMSKSNKEYVLDKYRAGVKLLTKVRHPKFLTVQHPLEESRESLAFATEPCYNALSNLSKCGSLTDVELMYGIMQLLDGIEFLHNELKRCHRNVCLDSIVINKQGLWKIFGLEFSSVSGESTEPPGPEFMFYDNEPFFSQPHVGYIAPELLSTKFGDTSADMYSIGCLIYALFNRGTTLRNAETCRVALIRSDEIAQMPSTSLGSVPTEAANDIKQLLALSPSARQQVEILKQSSFLSDIGAVSLQFLDHVMLKNRTQKIAFFKELPNILPRLPVIVRKKRILTQLFECCKDVDLIPFILPSIFHIGTDLDNQDFQMYISPGLKPMMSITDPPHIPLIIIRNLHLIISKSKLEDSKSYVLPVLFRSLENSMVELQETVLKLLPEIVDLMDYSTLRHQLLPKIKMCCLETRLLKIRVGSLICIAKVLDSNLVDKSLAADLILPLLEQVPSREPAVLMSIIGIYQKLLKHKSNLLDKDVLATRCIPIIFPMLVSPSLNVQQFNTCTAIVKDMISKVESEQLGKLKQLECNRVEQEQSLSFSKEVVENKQVGELVTKMDQMFGSNSSPKLVKTNFVSDNLQTSKPSSFSPTTASAKPAQPKKSNYDQLAPTVMSNNSRKSSTASNASSYDASMFNMVSGSKQGNVVSTSQPPSQPAHSSSFADFTNFSMNSSSANPTSMMMPAMNSQANGSSRMGSNTPGAQGFGSQFSGMNTVTLGNNMHTAPGNNFSNTFGNTMAPNSSSFGNFSTNTSQVMNTGFPNMTNNYVSSMGTQSGMMGMNYQSNQPSTVNSLDNLFGPKASRPSLQQLSNTQVKPINQQAANQAANQAAIDLNDLFG